MAFNIGVVKAGLAGMGGRVIESARVRAFTSRAAINMMHAPPAWTGRALGMIASMNGLAGPVEQKAMMGMLRGAALKGTLQGAAIGAGVAGGRQMFRNAYSGDRPLMSGVGGAAFRGGLWGSQIGGAVSAGRAAFGSSSKAWAGLAQSGNLANSSQMALFAQGQLATAGTQASMMRMERTLLREAATARRAAARAAKG